MEDRVFTEGVRPGSVTTVKEVQTLICVILRRCGEPITLSLLSDVLQRQSLVNYFEYNEAVKRLRENRLLEVSDSGVCSLTPDGGELAEALGGGLPSSVCERALAALDDVLTLLRRQKENAVRIEKAEDGYLITLTLTDIGSDLMSLTLFLATPEQCGEVRRRFLNDPIFVYKGVMALATGDLETFGHLIPNDRNLL